MLELKNVSFTVDTENGEKQILKDINLKIDEGFVVIHVENKYLVASTNPNADLLEIFTFYKEYVYVS